MTVPDSIEPYIGWKALLVCHDGRLRSPQLGSEWPIGTRFEATCPGALYWKWTEVPEDLAKTLAEKMSPITFGSLPPMPPKRPRAGYTWFPQPEEFEHPVVDKMCSCGIYAVSQFSGCSGYLKFDTVLAQVAVWGRTVIAKNGVRGQYAYPQKLIAPKRLAHRAALAGELYGVPVEIDDTKFVPMHFVSWAPPRNQPQASLVPLTLALLVSSFAATLALFGHGSFLLSTLSAALVITSIVYTKFG